jgi:ribosomal protein S18 acetylase RimI-like enzyme
VINDGYETPEGAQPASTHVLRANVLDIPRLATTLARAFADDPVTVWLLPRSRRRWRMAALFDLLLRSQIGLGETYSTPDGVGAAVWAPPDHWRFDVGLMIDSIDQFRSIVGTNLERAVEVYATLERAHPVDQQHWYLATLGTHPDWQGSGIGAALMGPVLSRADAESLPAYLESSKESNIAYYRRHGFEVQDELRLPNGGPTVWPMWREPQKH